MTYFTSESMSETDCRVSSGGGPASGVVNKSPGMLDYSIISLLGYCNVDNLIDSLWNFVYKTTIIIALVRTRVAVKR